MVGALMMLGMVAAIFTYFLSMGVDLDRRLDEKPARESAEPRPRTLDLRCPYCHDAIDPLDLEVHRCGGCAAEYHQECWNENRCATLGCSHRRRVDPTT